MAIIDIGGRQVSVRTSKEDLQLLESDFSELSPEERIFVETIIRETQENQDGVKTLLKLAEEAEYEREVVDIEQWLDDDYFFGEITKGLWPKLRTDLIDLFTGSYHELVLGGALGWGKSTFAEIVMARQIYEMSCMRNPQRSYGLASGSEIVFAGISVNEKTAMATLLEGLSQKLVVSPYFNEQFKCHRSMESLRFPKNIWAVPASSADNSVIGRNVFGAAIDETNFMSFTREQKASHARWGHVDKGSQLYSGILRRMKSRFLRGGQMPGMLMVISSKKGTTDFTERKIRESADNPRIFVREYALWDVKQYSDKKFRVVIGTDDTSSRVLADSEPVPDTVASGKQRIIEVPVDFRTDFEDDLDGSLRDIAGIATDAVRPYIKSKEKIAKALSSTRPLPRPGGLEWDPTTPLALDWSALSVELQRRTVSGKQIINYKPRFNPAATRHIHLDPALTDDSYGFGMGHVAKMVEVVRTDWSSGKRSKEMVPFIVMDLVLRIVPPERGEIPMHEVRRLIYELTEHGFNIGLVTTDTYQSADMRQKLISKGYKAEVLSVDSSSDGYDMLKGAINEERFECLAFPHLEKELRQLEWNPRKKKVDHPQDGSKDVADTCAGVVSSLTTRLVPAPLVASKGISEYKESSMEDLEWVLPKNEKGEPMRPKEDPPGSDQWTPLMPVKG